MIQATPAKKPSTRVRAVTISSCCDQREREQQQPGRRQREAEQPLAREAVQQPRPAPHAEPEAEEDGAEQDAVAGVAAAEVGDEGAGEADHHAAGREAPRRCR